MTSWTTTVRMGFGRFFEYDTPKIVHIRSLRVGILYRLVQLIIIVYVIGFVMVYKKGYQETDSVESSVTSKVKGVVLTNVSLFGDSHTERIWDTADYVVPPQENGAFFVTTNVIVTPNQEQGICPESDMIELNDPWSHQLGQQNCSSDADCLRLSQSANGVRNGTCSRATSTCYIYAWCPVENDIEPEIPVLNGTDDFTVLVKNQIIFPKFGVKRRNILEAFSTNASRASCINHPVNDPYCPIFRLGDIVSQAGENYTALAGKGAVIGFVIQWDCNLDLSVEKCLPQYSFRRIDNANDVSAKGWNFRYANYWTDTNNNVSVQRRTMVKAFGIRFIFYVYGAAGKFNIVPFAMNLGAGLALLGLAVIFCDVAILYCSKRRKFYSENKYYEVKDDDAFLIEDSQRSSSYTDIH